MSGGFIPDEDLPQGGRRIVRRGYITHHRGKTVRVSAKRILDQGAPGKWQAIHGPGIGEMKEGLLTTVGYSAKKGKTVRHRAIRKAVRKYGSLSTLRKLNAISILTKRTSKGRSSTFKADRNWVKKTFLKD
jgi:hypothetical protein